MTLPPVTVVIPTWNAAAFIQRMLPPLLAQDLPEFEILVVDNGVVNRETEVAVRTFQAGFPRLRYLRFEKQLGYAGAVNEGAKAASFPLVAVINNDNLAEPGWLKALVEAHQRLKAEGREAIVSSLVTRPDFPEPLASRINFCGRLVRSGTLTEKYLPFHPDGSAFLFNRDIFGLPYDVDYFIYHEDTYLGWRAWLTGNEVALAENSRALTFDGGSTRRIAYRTAFFTERNRWLNFLIFPARGTILKWLPMLWLDAVLGILAGSNRRAKVHAWVSILGGIGKVFEKRRNLQRQRKRPDREILPLISGTYLNGSGPAAVVLNPLFRGWAALCRLPFGP